MNLENDNTHSETEAGNPHGVKENERANYSDITPGGTGDHPEEQDTEIEETADDSEADEISGDLAGNASGNEDSEE